MLTELKHKMELSLATEHLKSDVNSSERVSEVSELISRW